MKTCKNCQKNFEVTPEDSAFCKNMEVPEPTWCPNCIRFQHFIQINQLNLFKRTCDATGKTIITHSPPESPQKIYDIDYWMSDAFDATEFGRDYDFNRPFFEQWQDLNLEVPQKALIGMQNVDENSAYTNYAGFNKNCYLLFDSDVENDYPDEWVKFINIMEEMDIDVIEGSWSELG